jgi:SAM-dependent methyltransferase
MKTINSEFNHTQATLKSHTQTQPYLKDCTHASISPFLEHIPNLPLQALSSQDYLESYAVFSRATNRLSLVLAAALGYGQKFISSQTPLRILSVGCGDGTFEQPFLEQLILGRRHSPEAPIFFVGVNPNQTECIAIQERFQRSVILQQHDFAFAIESIGFESFFTDHQFDIILCINPLIYIKALDMALEQAYGMLRKGGQLMIANAPFSPLCQPFVDIAQQLWGQKPRFSEDIQQAIDAMLIPYQKQSLVGTLDITDCFEPQSELGIKLLDFLVHAKTEYFSGLQREKLLDFFRTHAQADNKGKMILPHPEDVFCLEK